MTRTMARQLSGLMHTLGVLPGPDRTPAQRPTEKKRRRRLSPSKPDSPPAPKPGTKRQRQSFLPCLRRGSLPEAQPSLGSTPPKGGKAPSSCHSPRICPATVIKSRVPLGPSAVQNCSTPLALPSRDLNTTFDLSEEPPSKLGFLECAGWENVPQEPSRLDQPFIPRWVTPPASLPSFRARVWGSARDRRAAQSGSQPDSQSWDICHLSPFGLTSVAPQAREGHSSLTCLSVLQSRRLCAGLWRAHQELTGPPSRGRPPGSRNKEGA